MDWAKMIMDLNKSGLSSESIADLVGCTSDMVRKILNGQRGKHLSYNIGSELIKLHQEKVGAK